MFPRPDALVVFILKTRPPAFFSDVYFQNTSKQSSGARRTPMDEGACSIIRLAHAEENFKCFPIHNAGVIFIIRAPNRDPWGTLRKFLGVDELFLNQENFSELRGSFSINSRVQIYHTNCPS